MLEKFDKYWSGCHIVMAVAAVLDPRYKIKILEFYFPIMYGSEALSEIGKIRQICYDFLSEYQSNSKIGEILWNQVQVSLTPIMMNKIHFLSMIYLFIVLLEKVV